MNAALIVLVAAALGLANAQLSLDPTDPNYLAQCGYRPFYKPNSDDIGIAANPVHVVGGNVTFSGDHPWQVAILRNGAFICGASILDQYTVVTAAHCTILTNPAIYTIVRTNTRSPLDLWSQSRVPSKVVNHPAYTNVNYQNDISLFFFDESQKFDFTTSPTGSSNPYIGAACLPDSDPTVNATSIATGWGHQFSGGMASLVLREAEMPITQESSILAYYGNRYNPVVAICAAYPGDGLDTCQQDSGGPLSVAQTGNDMGKLKLVGLTSWGFGCGDIGVYTRVSSYIPWIRQNHNEWLSNIRVALPKGK